MSLLSQQPQWQPLKALAPLATLQAKSSRILSAASLTLDYSKNLLDDKIFSLLVAMARAQNLERERDALFSGNRVNVTEQRAVTHWAQRASTPSKAIAQTRSAMRNFVEQIHTHAWLGFSGEPITDIVNLGVGGSDLGPKMVTRALRPYQHKNIRCHFVSNIDPTDMTATLQHCRPANTLFILASKSFTTLETLMNAQLAKDWLTQAGCIDTSLGQHLVAVTAAPEIAAAFGVNKKQIFPMQDSVGGRFSLWSTIGLPIALATSMDCFEALLAGAAALDEHFCTAPLESNMPVILALLQIWYRNFLMAQTQAILPYACDLAFLPDYLQQLEMESNGKSVSKSGKSLDYDTAPILWGGVGTVSQHAIAQLLHQGTSLVPVDFILPLQSHNPLGDHQDWLVANCKGQIEALASGTQAVPAHKQLPGNKPSNLIQFQQLTPETLGALIALYEHKVFTAGILWDINSFDQWGVELGKRCAKTQFNS